MGPGCVQPLYATDPLRARVAPVGVRYLDGNFYAKDGTGACQRTTADDADFWLVNGDADVDAAFPVVTERTE